MNSADRAGLQQPAQPVSILWSEVASDLNTALADLSLSERARAARYRSSVARDEFILGAWLVRRGGACITGQQPRQIRVSRACTRCGGDHGRPRLSDTPSVQVSVTHSFGRVGVAFGIGTDLGLDLERVPESIGLHTIEGTLTSEERSLLETMQGPELATSFTRLWCKKEAVLKVQNLAMNLLPVELCALGERPRFARNLHGVASLQSDSKWIDVHSPWSGFEAALFTVEPRSGTTSALVRVPLTGD